MSRKYNYFHLYRFSRDLGFFHLALIDIINEAWNFDDGLNQTSLESGPELVTQVHKGRVVTLSTGLVLLASFCAAPTQMIFFCYFLIFGSDNFTDAVTLFVLTCGWSKLGPLSLQQRIQLCPLLFRKSSWSVKLIALKAFIVRDLTSWKNTLF